MAKKILPSYYSHKHRGTWNKNSGYRTQHQKCRSERCADKEGNLDKIEFTGKQVTVVDYKTGKLKYAKDKLLRPTQ